MKIQMLKSRPKPGGSFPCYLKGQTYTLATEAEVAMAKRFLADGSAKDVTPEAEAPGEEMARVIAEVQAVDTPAPAPARKRQSKAKK